MKKCKDCGKTYNPEAKTKASHADICEAKTCEMCWETGDKVLKPAGKLGFRVCARCRNKLKERKAL